MRERRRSAVWPHLPERRSGDRRLKIERRAIERRAI